jgi:hypothetical protein
MNLNHEKAAGHLVGSRSRRPLLMIPAALAFFAGPLWAGPQAASGNAAANSAVSIAASASASIAGTASTASTEKDQVDMCVTVYNSNLALVKDVRQVEIPGGETPVRFEDVASSINPATVHLRSLTDPARLRVVEQNYEYDLLNPAKLLQKYVGREVTIVQKEKENNSTKWVETKALLLSNNDGPVWKIGNDIVTGLTPQGYRFADLPANLYTRPTLVWRLANDGGHSQRVEVSYLTADVNWKADYVLTVARDDKQGDLDGWVTIENNSGAAYHNAQLQLVAGAVHRAEAPLQPMVRMAMAGAAPKPSFAQEAFGEYHLYTLEHRTSIENKETKQISLLGAKSVPLVKLYRVSSQGNYASPAAPGEPEKPPVAVYYKFRNDEKSSLGMPLPAGVLRVYQADSAGRLQFAGEDNIQHTPKDEDVTINTGNAFDIVCERKQRDFQVIADRASEAEWQVTLRNHKDTPVAVEIRETIYGSWQVVNSNFSPTKLDANTLSFSVLVAADGAATLTYRVRSRW